MEQPKVLEHWNNPAVESMYDKTLLRLETENLKQWIPEGSYVCDMGCGEGEATLEYSRIPGVRVLGVDNSLTRLELAQKRLSGLENVKLRQASVFDSAIGQFDVVVSQRMLVNLSSWDEQKRGLLALMTLVRPGGRVLLSEGSLNGFSELNDFREDMGLPPIPIPAHNVFISDADLQSYAVDIGLKLSCFTGIGTYYLLTRGVQPALTKDIRWDSEFNTRASRIDIPWTARYSRIKQWCFIRG